jgi:hypothetical protein
MDQSIFFNRVNGLYVYDLEEAQRFAMVTTVEERKKRYKKREIKAAEDAKELLSTENGITKCGLVDKV